ncbi:MAG: hypothetical protein II180_02755 [Proteobacteria bacterium]|nr:hypothetical protein [Pseudomonadota bacterium]
MRAVQIIYFIILFAILGSYLVFAIPSNALRLHVAAAESLAPDQQNMVAVWARNLDNGSIFSGYTMRARWVDEALQPVADKSTSTMVGYTGDAVFPMPEIPDVAVAALEVTLIDMTHAEKKSAFLPVSVFHNQPKMALLPAEDHKESDSSVSFHALAPAAFMFNSPNSVILSLFENGKAFEGNLQISQVYGQKAAMPDTVVMKDGLARVSIALQSAADIKVTAGDREFYMSFVPNERPLNVRINDYQITPEKHPEIRVTPVGSMPPVTIDYFEGGAWIDRQSVRPEAASKILLEPKMSMGQGLKLVYARVSTTVFTTGDNAQVFPIILSPRELSELEQLQFALKSMGTCEGLHPEIAQMREVLNEKKPSASTVRTMREYVMAQLASCHTPSVEVRVRSEDRDQQIFASRKNTQKRISNYLLVFWFGLGGIGSVIMIVRQRRKARERWEELMSSGDVEVSQLPEQTSALQLFYVVILFIGFMISLFYIMQVI